MRVWKATSSAYLGIGFAISTAAFLVLGLTSQAQAQTDLNLQSSLEINAAPLLGPPLQRTIVTTGAKQIDCSKLSAAKLAQFNARQDAENPELREKSNLKKLDLRQRCFAAPKFNVTAQPTSVRFSLSGNPSYETNVFKSDQNLHSDSSYGFAGGVQYSGPGFGKFDIVSLSGGATAARYSQFPVKSADALTSTGAYQLFLGAYDYELHWIDTNHYVTQPQGKITVQTLSFGFQNLTGYLPTFHSETADLFTPQITFGRQNISLDGDSKCRPGHVPAPKPDTKPDANDSFCTYADLSVTAGQTMSDLGTQDNANVAGVATFGRRFNNTDFVLTLTSMATARSYEHVSGGRNDLLLQFGPMLKYTPGIAIPNTSFSASLAVNYYQNYSSVSAARWHGIIVQPVLMATFTAQ